MKKIYLFCLAFLVQSVCYAQQVPSRYQASGVEAGQQIQERDLQLRDELSTDRPSTVTAEEPSVTTSGAAQSQKVLVRDIQVEGADRMSSAEVQKLVAPYENRELSLAEMEEAAAKITDAYRQKGLITSRAFLPPQKVDSGVLKIQVAEGRMGKVQVQGNKYFSTDLIKRKIDLPEGEAFDYNQLRTGLSNLNESPDRKVKTVLRPGTEQGTTDLLLDVDDRLPLHFGLSYDNYGSRYLGRDRYMGRVTHNNLLGFDDIMTVTYQIGEGHNTYRFNSVRYLVPTSNETQVGLYAGRSQLQLGREFADLNARGKSKFYSLYFTHSLYNSEVTEFQLNGGFDYKDVFNFELGQETSRDRLRVGRLGFKVDHSDALGRTILNNEINQGIPELGGSLDEKDPKASRVGGGGKFTKNVLDILRLQPMPLESTLLLKGQGQLSSHVLTATEQYQLGGIANVRAFPLGEAVGDNGASASAELSFPVYFLPKEARAPWSKVTIYDALRLAVFYDWGTVSLRTPQPGEAKSRTLIGAGCGVRYDLPEDFSMKVDVAWPLDETPSDETHAHTWVKVSKDF